MSQKVVLADNYAVFRAGTARFLAVEDDFSVVGQCDDLPRFYKAIDTVRGAIVLTASSLKPDLTEMVARAAMTRVQFVALLDVFESPQPYLRHNISGVLYRDVSREEMLRCLRTVARGGKHIQQPSTGASVHLEADMVGQKARDRLSKKELQIIGLLVQGYKNKDIALELNNSEQVIKNYLRSIFDKTGVSDRLELALFTLHHHILLEAAGNLAAGNLAAGHLQRSA
jgi:DNA-binding NarL/FixJ family response regulator